MDWIAVSDRKPSALEDVLVYVTWPPEVNAKDYIAVGAWEDELEYWMTDYHTDGFVTHWMQLPEPPAAQTAREE